VAYSTSAKVLLPLMAMDSNGVADAEAAINAMLANGQTNIWDGLLKGLEVLASEEADASRNKAVMLLTDGQPNIRPPRGEVGMMQQFMEGSDLMTTVSTFGSGTTWTRSCCGASPLSGRACTHSSPTAQRG